MKTSEPTPYPHCKWAIRVALKPPWGPWFSMWTTDWSTHWWAPLLTHSSPTNTTVLVFPGFRLSLLERNLSLSLSLSLSLYLKVKRILLLPMEISTTTISRHSFFLYSKNLLLPRSLPLPISRLNTSNISLITGFHNPNSNSFVLRRRPSSIAMPLQVQSSALGMYVSLSHYSFLTSFLSLSAISIAVRWNNNNKSPISWYLES